MRYLIAGICLLSLALLLGCSTQPAQSLDQADAQKMGQKESAWRMLFDGNSTQAWRGYRQDDFPEKGWEVVDGTLHVVANGGGGDLITRESFGNFELTLEWKVAEKANSGIMYLVTEEEDAPWKTGPEYQILDDMGYGVDVAGLHSSGSMYDLYAPQAAKKCKPAGTWNKARIVLLNGRIEHWLNGILLVECDLNSEDWVTRRDQSKFSVYKRFGRNKEGHISLQDHGNDVWFKDIKIRDLTPFD